MRIFPLFSIFFILGCLALLGSPVNGSKRFRRGTPKLLRVLNWLVFEKNDTIRNQMTEERINKFVDFVLKHQDKCEVDLDGNTSCDKLYMEIDGHKAEAGIDGIDFDKNSESFGDKLNELFKSNDFDPNTVKPYGVLSLLEWALEFGNHGHTRLSAGFPTQAKLDVLVKFIIVNKDTLWELINQGIDDQQRENLSLPSCKPLVNFVRENFAKMGFDTEKVLYYQVARIFGYLRDHFHLLEKKGQKLNN